MTLGDLPNWVIVLVVCVTTAAATEVTSNVATCSILLPVLKNLAVSLQIHPLYLLLPVTLSCSYAFMLPVATPPNAIVYSASGMSTSEMVRQFWNFCNFGHLACFSWFRRFLVSFGVFVKVSK